MRTRTTLILLTGAAAVATFAAVSAIAEGPAEQAAPGDSTYELDVTSVELADTPTGEHMAVVEYDASYSHGSFPGYAQCEATARGAGGEIVGRQAFEYASFDGEAAGKITVPVTGASASASIACAAATRPSEKAGYLISDPAVMDAETDSPWLTFRVDWATDESPRIQRCFATFLTADGPREFEFRISLPDGEQGHVLVPSSLAQNAVEDVTCRPY